MLVLVLMLMLVLMTVGCWNTVKRKQNNQSAAAVGIFANKCLMLCLQIVTTRIIQRKIQLFVGEYNNLLMY